MTHRNLLFRSAAREKILAGATTLADAIRVTLGPKSKSVLIQKKWGAPMVCNDGVTIAKEMELKDPEENLGAQVLRQAAERTGDLVGDGTSTSTILAHAIFADGVRNVAAGASAIDLKRGLDRATEMRRRGAEGDVAAGEARARKRRRSRRFRRTTTPAIGELIADAMEKIGDEGVISVEESKTTETVLDVVEGMQFDRGYVSPYFVTDSERMEAILEDPFILLSDRKISSLNDMLAFAGAGGEGGQAAVRRGRGRRRRSTRDIDRESYSRGPESLRSQGARLRRPPQGDAARHRRGDRRRGGLRGARIEARGREGSNSSAARAASSSTRTRRQSSAATGQRAKIDGRILANSAGDRKDHERLRS